MRGPDEPSRGTHWKQPFQRQTEACPHVTSYRPPRQAWTEAQLCNTNQRLSPEVWHTDKLSKFPAVGLLGGSTVHVTPTPSSATRTFMEKSNSLKMQRGVLSASGQTLAGTALAPATLPEHSATCATILAWHCAKKNKKRHYCWFKSPPDCAVIGQASATGCSEGQDIGRDGPRTSEVTAARKEGRQSKRKDKSTQINFFLGVLLGIIWPSELWQKGYRLSTLQLSDLRVWPNRSAEKQFSSTASWGYRFLSGHSV